MNNVIFSIPSAVVVMASGSLWCFCLWLFLMIPRLEHAYCSYRTVLTPALWRGGAILGLLLAWIGTFSLCERNISFRAAEVICGLATAACIMMMIIGSLWAALEEGC